MAESDEFGTSLTDVNVDELLAGLMAPDEMPVAAPPAPVANGAQTGEEALAAALNEVVAASEQPSVTEPEPAAEPQPVTAKAPKAVKPKPQATPLHTHDMSAPPELPQLVNVSPLGTLERLIDVADRLTTAMEKLTQVLSMADPGSARVTEVEGFEITQSDEGPAAPDFAGDKPWSLWGDKKDEPPGGQDLDGPQEGDKPRKRGRGRPRKNS